MQRYFIHNEDITRAENITIKNQTNFHHIKNVMRMDLADKIYCVMPDKSTYICEITAINEKSIDLKIVEIDKDSKELPVEVTIVQGLPKKNKLELIVQKGTELGANTFVVFPAEHSVAKWDDKKKVNKLKRLNKIAEEASEQSHRSLVPLVQFRTLSELIDQSAAYDLKLFAYENEAKQNHFNALSKALQNNKSIRSICIVIGPEGGFSQAEVHTLIENDFSSVRLGQRILRTETAPLYALSAISYEFEEKT